MRPFLVLSTFRARGQLRVITAPITTRNYDPGLSIAISPRVTEHLGLDDRSRIVWNDLNVFPWVGPAVRGADDGKPVIDIMPEAIWRRGHGKLMRPLFNPPHHYDYPSRPPTSTTLRSSHIRSAQT